MSQPAPIIYTCALPPKLAWCSLVDRSISAWDKIIAEHPTTSKEIATQFIKRHTELSSFLAESNVPNSGNPMFWFFQLRKSFLAQSVLSKWSPDKLDDYILLPALPGFVWRADCFFVSHYWRSPQHPDPDGKYLRLHQNDLRQYTWEYIWVDWTCMPQDPRSNVEQAYFRRCLRTVSGIIRNCAFAYFYPPFEAKLWILYEIAEFVFTCDGGLSSTPDLQPFLEHISEMQDIGVRETLHKYKYRCGYDRDWNLLVPWLELLVLMQKLPFDMDFIRKVMDDVTWFDVSGTQFYADIVEIDRYQGLLRFGGKDWRFTPFPKWRHDNLA
ncbi:unnamed protein product [Periconia digitata]|uniref:Uncharacterized protein n=1 Tax=Periconia digitata TaxID=1303443 RepID=A0A9W4UB22_9PLEO|nr:unnamed protein product [Periconia digitata]